MFSFIPNKLFAIHKNLLCFNKIYDHKLSHFLSLLFYYTPKIVQTCTFWVNVLKLSQFFEKQCDNFGSWTVVILTLDDENRRFRLISPVTIFEMCSCINSIAACSSKFPSSVV